MSSIFERNLETSMAFYIRSQLSREEFLVRLDHPIRQTRMRTVGHPSLTEGQPLRGSIHQDSQDAYKYHPARGPSEEYAGYRGSQRS